MTTKPKNDGGPFHPAFQYDGNNVPMARSEGASLRDWFAGMVVMGIHASCTDDYPYLDVAAQKAYEQADAMLAERDKP